MGPYPTLFTLTLTEVKAVLFLWHYSYPYGRLPLATTVSCAARTFLSSRRTSDYSASSRLFYHTFSNLHMLTANIQITYHFNSGIFEIIHDIIQDITKTTITNPIVNKWPYCSASIGYSFNKISNTNTCTK